MESIGLSWETIAASAYRAYGQSFGNKNYQGLSMPSWEDLPASIQIAWVCAVKHAGDLVKYLPEPGVSKLVPNASGLAEMEQQWAANTPRTGAQIVRDAIDQIQAKRGADESE